MLDQVEWLALWHMGMGVVSVVNLSLCLRALRGQPRRDRYETWMAALSVPMTCVCAFRAWFCEDYASRDVWYDTALSSILLHRCLAACAELAWIGQVSLAFAEVGSALPAHGARYRRAAAWLFGCIFVAEVCSCTGTVTTNRLFFLCEESSWVVGFTGFLPFAVGLARAVPKDDADWSSARSFAKILAVCVCCYVPWGWLSDVPSNYDAWQKDKGTHPYFGLWGGLQDAATTRHQTRSWDAWGHKLLWMTVYFSACVWTSIALVSSPRKRSKTLDEPLLVNC